MVHDSPPLSRRLLTRILGLSKHASAEQIEATAPRLLDRLHARLAASEAADPDALQREIADLEASRAYFSRHPEAGPFSGSVLRRRGLRGAILTAVFTLVLLIAHATGFRIQRMANDEAKPRPTPLAHLALDGRLPGATLSVLDVDRDELFFKGAAEGADVALAPGRYALEVSREDCPDEWTRTVHFEQGAKHRFEPKLCLGQGRLTVHSNVALGRLRIDGLDVGTTGDKTHSLAVGDHEIKVDKQDFQAFQATIRVAPDAELEILAELEALPKTTPGGPAPVHMGSPSKSPTTALAAEPSGLPSLDPTPTPEALDSEVIPPAFPGGPRISSEAGSTGWHDRVTTDLLARFDLDQSGLIDQLRESEAIPCRVWLDIERDFDSGGLGLAMTRYYGFDGTEWHPNALGFAKSYRSAAFEKMKECGLKN